MLVDVQWSDPLKPGLLTGPDLALSEEEVDWLWTLFVAIAAYWKKGFATGLLRSRWLDMIESFCGGDPSYLAEYRNAAATYRSLTDAFGPEDAARKFYGDTVIDDEEAATNRLLHAKYYVGHQFIGCFLAAGGFRAFVPKARNYQGFMGGSRFREWAPVRTGKRQ